MSLFVVLADANILISRTLRDYFVYSAKVGALDIHWSDSILEEVARNLTTKFSFTTHDATVLVDRLNLYLPRALVETRRSDEAVVSGVTMDDKDRHVLAAALSAGADCVLTDNTQHFPNQWMADHGIDLVRSGAMLQWLAAERPAALCEAHDRVIDHSPRTECEVLATLERTVGTGPADAVRAVVTSR